MFNSFATPRTAARQAPLSVELPRQEYWNGLPVSSPGSLSNPGDQTCIYCLVGGFFTTEPARKCGHKTRSRSKITHTIMMELLT